MYQEKHIYFLQHMIQVGCVDHDEALNIVNTLNEDEENNGSLENLLNSFITEINAKIAPQKLKIMVTRCEVRGKDFVIMVNLSDDEVYKHQIAYKPLELEYFQAILKEIVESEEKKIRQNIAINISTTLTAKLSHTAAEALLKRWFEGGYFVSKSGSVHLGPRCIQEYMSFLLINYKDDMIACNLCSEVTLFGRSCFYCKQTMHKTCLEKFLQKRARCPNCKNEWKEVTTNQNNVSMDTNDSELSSEELNETVSEDDEDSAPRPKKIRRKN